MDIGIRRSVLIFVIASALIFSLLPAQEVSAAAKKSTKSKVTSTRWMNVSSAYKQLNKYRRAKKRRSIKRNATLEKVARIRAKEIALTGKFSHTRPNGRSGLSLIKGNKYKGENIAMGQTSCAQVSRAWYASSGHRANMLKRQYRKVGIAGYKYRGIIYWVQVFSS